MLFKRNKMLFGRKSEKGKYLSPDEQPVFEGGINEAESESDLTMPEPERVKTASTVRKSKKTGKHRGRNELRSDLETKKLYMNFRKTSRYAKFAEILLSSMPRSTYVPAFSQFPSRYIKLNITVPCTSAPTAIKMPKNRIL